MNNEAPYHFCDPSSWGTNLDPAFLPSDDYGDAEGTAEKSKPSEGQIAENISQTVSNDVSRTLDHLRNNRITETEAKSLEEASRRSLVDHKTAKSLKSFGG